MNSHKIDRTTYLDPTLVIVYALILLVKCIIFGYFLCPDSDLPILSFQPYSIRLICTYSAFVALVLLIVISFNNKTISILVQIVMDVWLCGNLLYYRSYSDLLNSWCIQNVSNLDGLWDSILIFFEWKDIAFASLTVLWGVILAALRLTHYKWNIRRYVIPCIIGTMVLFIPQIVTARHNHSPVNPFSAYYHDVSMGRVWYSNTFSPIAHGINEIISLLSTHKNFKTASPSSEEMSLFLDTTSYVPPCANGNMLLIFFESLESWGIDCKVDGKEITPNLNRLIEHPNVSYIKDVIPQVKQGMSSDAQLIALTGLLPIQDGAVSMRFSNNYYYCLGNAVKFADKRVYIPTSPSEWNQGALTKAFGFDTLIAGNMSDRDIVMHVERDISNSVKEPFFVFFVTMASHAPFVMYADSSDLQLSQDIDKDLRNYLQSVHYTDACLAPLLDTILHSELSSRTTIAVLGDHSIFYDAKRKMFQEYFPHNSIGEHGTIPWIMYSPLTPEIVATDTIFQMDVYPTLLYLMGGCAYNWKGLGLNLYDTIPRKICADSAFVLSDKIISTNYFATQQ